MDGMKPVLSIPERMEQRMIARRIVTVVAALLGLAGLGAGSPGATTREIQAVARTEAAIRNVPSTFRLPPGSQVTNVSDAESGATFTLTAPDPEAVLSFYRRQLPLGAFTIVADRS